MAIITDGWKTALFWILLVLIQAFSFFACLYFFGGIIGGIIGWVVFLLLFAVLGKIFKMS